MFYCPTYQRPLRLLRLADAWEETAPSTRLTVGVLKSDPEYDAYMGLDWPDTWTIWDGRTEERALPALNEFYAANPGQKFYGFIGDDVVPRTTGWAKALIEEAGDWYIAYPNDCLQRHQLPTHPVIGGRLLGVVGFWAVKGLMHNFGLDNFWLNIGLHTGTLRYRPDVVMEHEHALLGKAKEDAGYKFAAEVIQSEGKWWEDHAPELVRNGVLEVRQALRNEFELPALQGKEIVG